MDDSMKRVPDTEKEWADYDLWKVCKVLPSDYSTYGGKVERWKDKNKPYPDCSSGCRYWRPLDGGLGCDWGICANPKSPRAGLLTWEHQAGQDCFRTEIAG
jgi:hypothetical protein